MAQYDWIPARSLGTPKLVKREPQVDKEVSKIVGTKVLATDPRLLKLVVEEKRGKDPDSDTPHRILQSEEFRKKLKATFNPN